MGCFNTICAISNMPIKHGDDVVFLILAESKEYIRAVGLHPTDFWVPHLVPVYAKYDDYGSIEDWQDSEQPILSFLARNYKQSLVEKITIGEYECSDVLEVNRENVTFPLLLAWLGRSWVCSLDSRRKPVRNTHIMIRRGVWDAILAAKTSNMWQKKPAFNQIAESVDALLDACSKAEGDEIFKILDFSNTSSLPDDAPEYTQHLHALVQGEGPWFSLLAIKDEMSQAVLNGQLDAANLESFRVLYTRMVEVYYVNNYFDIHGLTWHPTTGNGKQEFDPLLILGHHMLCAQEGLKLVKAKNVERLYESGITKKRISKVTLGFLDAILIKEKTNSSLFTKDKWSKRAFDGVKSNLKKLESFKKMFD